MMNMLRTLIKWWMKKEVYVDINIQAEYERLLNEHKSLLHKVKVLISVNKKEKYWNEKREATNTYTYRAREKTYVDPRIFMTKDSVLPQLTGDGYDDLANNCLNWVFKNIEYVPDLNSRGQVIEKWNFPYETMKFGVGDCDDGAILLANTLVTNGIPYWRVRINVGRVKDDYHAWVTYLSSSGSWMVLDWCYHPIVSLRGLKWKEAENYLHVDFSFNEKFIFVNDVRLDRE